MLVPTYTRYDHEARIAVLEARGVVTPVEAVEQFRTVCAELAELCAPDAAHPYGVLIDTRESTTVPTRGNIFQVLDEMCALRRARLPHRWAILATKPVHYGMGRLFQAHAEEQEIGIQVFTCYDDAIAWLSGSAR